jgi:hypothetical protein
MRWWRLKSLANQECHRVSERSFIRRSLVGMPSLVAAVVRAKSVGQIVLLTWKQVTREEIGLPELGLQCRKNMPSGALEVPRRD